MRLNCLLCNYNYQTESSLLKQDYHLIFVVIQLQLPDAHSSCLAHIQLLDSHLLATNTSQASLNSTPTKQPPYPLGSV